MNLIIDHFESLLKISFMTVSGRSFTGFSFQISGRGGNGPPPQGGDSRGGLGPEGGGMARDSVATNKLINNVYKRGLSWI